MEGGAAQSSSSGALALLRTGDLPKPAEEEGASGTDRTAGDAGFGGAAGVNAGVVGTGRFAPAALIAEIFGAPTGT